VQAADHRAEELPERVAVASRGQYRAGGGLLVGGDAGRGGAQRQPCRTGTDGQRFAFQPHGGGRDGRAGGRFGPPGDRRPVEADAGEDPVTVGHPLGQEDPEQQEQRGGEPGHCQQGQPGRPGGQGGTRRGRGGRRSGGAPFKALTGPGGEAGEALAEPAEREHAEQSMPGSAKPPLERRSCIRRRMQRRGLRAARTLRADRGDHAIPSKWDT
jgi:hypothetical protein